MARLRDFCFLSTVLLFSVVCCASKLGAEKQGKRATGKVVQLSVKKIDELQDALFGGNVWLIACKPVSYTHLTLPTKA